MQRILVEKSSNIDFEEHIESSTQINFIPIFGLVPSPISFLSLTSLLPHKALLPGTFIQYSQYHLKSRVAVVEFQCDGQAEEFSQFSNAFTQLSLSSIEHNCRPLLMSHSASSEPTHKTYTQIPTDLERNFDRSFRDGKQESVVAPKSNAIGMARSPTKGELRYAAIDVLRSTKPQNNPPTVTGSHPVETLEALHLQVSERYNPKLGVCKDYSAIAAVISSYGISLAFSHSIAQQLLSLHSSADSNISNLRVSLVHPFVRDDCIWAVIAWRQNDDTDVLAIFHINEDNPDSACNWLIHYGHEENPNGSSPRRWARTSIAWIVTSIGNLKSLFGAARHILGIIELPRADSLTLYCGPEEGIDSEEILPRYAKLLCVHLLNLQMADTIFDEWATKFYALSSKQVLQHRDGTQFSVLRGWYLNSLFIQDSLQAGV